MNRTEKITLISLEYIQDDIGEWYETYVKTDVFAMVNSITMKEFYQGGLQGIKPEFKFSIWETEYSDQENIEYKGKVYNIYRAYRRDDGRIELYVNEKKGEEDNDDE